MNSLSLSRISPERLPFYLALFVILVMYVLLHTRYYVYYIDDAWFVSRAFEYLKTGQTEDFHFRTADAPDRILLFEKTYYFFYGHILQLVGWTKSNAILLSTLFTWLTAFLWYHIIKRLGFSENLAKLFSLSLLILPIFFSTGNLTRPDAMAFFFCSLTFLVFIQNYYLLAGFLTLFSLETHLMGVSCFFYCLAYAIYARKELFPNVQQFIKIGVLYGIGTVIGMLYYYFLHSDVLSWELFKTVLMTKKEMKGALTHYILRYFIQGFWYRHVWELVPIGMGVYLFIKHKIWKKHAFVPVFIVVMLLSTFITSRPNWHYMIYFYPALLLLVLYTFEQMQILRTLVISVASVLFVLYGAHYVVNRNADFQKTIEETRGHLVDASLPIVGMPDNWFAAPERQFYPIYTSVTWIPDLRLQEAYVIRNDYIGHRSKNYASLLEWFNTHYDMEQIARFKAFDDHHVEIFHAKLRQ